MTHPDNNVVVRQKRGNPSTVYIQHAPSVPDQFLYRTREEAVSQVLAFAKHAHVAAWFTNDEDDFVLLGTFRKEKSANCERVPPPRDFSEGHHEND